MLKKLFVVAIGIVFLISNVMGAKVEMEKVSYGGWPNCVKLTNGKMELIITTDVGPRVIRMGMVGGQNMFKEWKDQLGQTGGEEWRIYGGHRLWHAPEVMPRTYAPDNTPIQTDWNGTTLKLTQPTEPSTGIAKEIEITLEPNVNKVTLVHTLINNNCWDVELSLWCLTVMNEGGRGIYPQEPYKPHPDCLVPARPVVLWHFTDMSDPRWTWGKKYIQLQQDPKATTKQKIGLMNKQGWAAYALNGQVFIKRFDYFPYASYPDYGCNFETYTQPDMLEVETLSPLSLLTGAGGRAEHVERWYLYDAEIGKDEASIDKVLLPLVDQTE